MTAEAWSRAPDGAASAGATGCRLAPAVVGASESPAAVPRAVETQDRGHTQKSVRENKVCKYKDVFMCQSKDIHQKPGVC